MARRGISCALVFAAGQAFSQTAPSNEPAPPTFSAGTKLVQVDVVARSKGAPATGLTKEDFTVFDNGKPQKISFFSVRSNRATGLASPVLPPGAVSNRTERDDEALAHATVLLIDQKNTLQVNQAFAIRRIVKFLQERRNKSDRIGIYTFGKDGKLQVVQDLTDNGELLSRAAGSLKAQDPNFRSADLTGMTARAATEHIELLIRERAMETKQVLEATAKHLASVPGRKSLIWVSVGFPLTWPPQPGPDAADIDFNPDMEQTARVLNDANVVLYAVDARGLRGVPEGATGISDAESARPRPPGQLVRPAPQARDGYPAGLDTMARLSGLTGGLLFTDDNGIENLIQAAMADGELTYTLGFYPVQEQDGNWHNLKVEVDRPGVNVRYRENYFAAKTTAAPAPAPATNNQPKTLEALLKDPLDAAQLRLVTETMPDPAKPGFWQVRVTVDLHDVHLENQDNVWVGGVDVSLSIDGSRGYRTVSATVKIPDARLAGSLEKGIVVNDSIEGTGQTGQPGVLRVVAQDRATGAVGSVRVSLGKK